MKTLAVLLLGCAAAYAQYSAINASVDTPNGSITLLNGKPNSQSGAGAPAGSCTAGKDIYLDTAASRLYYCDSVNHWTIVPLQLSGASTQYLRGDNTLQPFNTAARLSLSATSPITYDNTTGIISCPSCGAGSGLTSLNGLNGTSQTFTNTNDTNMSLTITSSGTAHTFALAWLSTLAKARQHAATVYTDQANTWSTGIQDFSAATHFRVPNAAGYTPTTNGHFGYDTTANAFKGYTGASVHTFAFLDSNITGNAATATALAGTPTLCSTGNAPTGILANGNATGCAAVGGGGGGTGNAASVVTTTFSATPTFTCPSSTAGTVTSFKLSTALTGNITSSTLASCTTGQTLNFTFVQDATGGRTVAMPTGFSQACPVSTLANATTNMSFYWDGTTAQKQGCNVDIGPPISGSEVAAPATPAATQFSCWPDSTDHSGIECMANGSGSVFKLTLSGVDVNPTTGQVTNGSHITNASIPNSGLVNASMTVGGATCTLGGSCTPSGGGGGTGVGRNSLTATWSAIVDFGCQDQTATWTGVTTADSVVLGSPSGFAAGLTASAWVSAADTVKIRICNLSGASVTPGGQTFSGTLAVYNLSGTATIDFGAIVDGTCASNTFTLTGVAAGDPLNPKWPAALEAGLFGSMVASATNTVQVRLCNLSGASLDPASATFGAAVAK